MERLPYYKLLHLFSLLVLTAHTFMAFGNPEPANRKRTLVITGIAGLLMLVSGFGMLALNKIPIATGWVIVKLFCWLGFTALAGLVYRKAQLRDRFSFIGLGLLLLALVMVYLKPF